MIYKKLSIAELNKFPYPNLIAEIIESGYGMHTISDFMGHGNTYDTKEMIGKKLNGEEDIFASEANGLAKLFGVKMDYLFSNALSVVNEKSEAYWRWYYENERKQAEVERGKDIMLVYNAVRENPDLLSFIKKCVLMTEQQREVVLRLLHEKEMKKAG